MQNETSEKENGIVMQSYIDISEMIGNKNFHFFYLGCNPYHVFDNLTVIKYSDIFPIV